MKKNKMMRLASCLLVAVLLTTSMISGTFAKYVTTNGGSDSASVAKFGVAINVNNDLGMFSTEYNKEDGAYKGTLSVKSEASDQIVAPGTKGSMTFTITGKPEVATRVAVDFGEDTKAIQLAAGTYKLPAGYFGDEETEVTTTAVYEPIKFYFGNKAEDALVPEDYTMTLEQLKAAMVTAFTKDYPVNYDFAGSENYTLAWSWAFENAVENVDFLDTYLGYQAATAAAQQEVLDFDITVTQID